TDTAKHRLAALIDGGVVEDPAQFSFGHAFLGRIESGFDGKISDLRGAPQTRNLLLRLDRPCITEGARSAHKSRVWQGSRELVPVFGRNADFIDAKASILELTVFDRPHQCADRIRVM